MPDSRLTALHVLRQEPVIGKHGTLEAEAGSISQPGQGAAGVVHVYVHVYDAHRRGRD